MVYFAVIITKHKHVNALTPGIICNHNNDRAICAVREYHLSSVHYFLMMEKKKHLNATTLHISNSRPGA